MEEQEFQEKNGETQESTKIKGSGKIGQFLFMIIKRAVQLGVLFFCVTVLWKIGNAIYSRTMGVNDNQSSTIDYYPKEEKKQPYAVKKVGDVKLRTVPINGQEQGATVRLKLAIAYESPNKKLERELEEREVQINDIIRNLLIRKVYRDFKDPERIMELKKEIKDSVNSVLVNGEISDIYFDQFDIVPR